MWVRYLVPGPVRFLRLVLFIFVASLVLLVLLLVCVSVCITILSIVFKWFCCCCCFSSSSSSFGLLAFFRVRACYVNHRSVTMTMRSSDIYLSIYIYKHTFGWACESVCLLPMSGCVCVQICRNLFFPLFPARHRSTRFSCLWKIICRLQFGFSASYSFLSFLFWIVHLVDFLKTNDTTAYQLKVQTKTLIHKNWSCDTD